MKTNLKNLSFIATIVMTTLPMFVFGSSPSNNTLDLKPVMDEASTNRIVIKFRNTQSVRTANMSLFAIAQNIAHQSGSQLKYLRTTSSGSDVFIINQEMKLSAVSVLAKKISAADPSVEYAHPDPRFYPGFSGK